MRMEQESRNFVFEQEEGSRELPKVKLDADAWIHPAYLPKNDDGSKGELAGYYFTTGPLKAVRVMIKLRQCLPWKFGSNYSSTLNGRWKIHTKKDEKGRHKSYFPFLHCKICEHVIKDVCHSKLGFILCPTCFDKSIAENAGKDEKLAATLEGNDLGCKVKFLRRLVKDKVKEIKPSDILVAY